LACRKETTGAHVRDNNDRVEDKDKNYSPLDFAGECDPVGERDASMEEFLSSFTCSDQTGESVTCGIK
jgi:hypothetical protein